MFSGHSELTLQSQLIGAKVRSFLGRALSSVRFRRNARRLRLCETLSLGEKRFIAVVKCDRQTFLLAGTPSSISVLQRLEEASGDGEPCALKSDQ
jgi:flagellar biogenesis protein FliO